jgi:basic amino acid/polyamine antiporter, APA family
LRGVAVSRKLKGPQPPQEDMQPKTGSLKRVLGLGFGLAMAFGGTVGVGILRLPATLAAALGDAHLIILFWIFGGVYALLGAMAVSELIAMDPKAGGFYVFARRAFGSGPGFAIAWCDWFNMVCTLAYASLTAADFFATLVPGAAHWQRLIAIGVVVTFTALHWVGIRLSDLLTRCISTLVGIMLLTLVVACFFAPAAPAMTLPSATAAVSLPLFSFAMLSVVITALRSVFVSYDGWYSPIYAAEESTDPGHNLPRAIIGGTVLLAAIYVLINVAIVRVLPMEALAASPLPAADAARIVLPRGGAELVTIISLATVLSLLNATLLMPPRILFGMARDGLFTAKAALVSAGGTPRVALGITSGVACVLILSGTFDEIVGAAAVLFLLCYLSAYVALIVLRRREPQAERPYRAPGFPYTTAVVLLGCTLLFIGTWVDDPRSGLMAFVLLALSSPLFLWIKRRRAIAATVER